MIEDGRTARELFEDLRRQPPRARIGFGARAALINVDLQRAYTDVGTFATAYETDPAQLEHVNALAAICRVQGFPVVWSYVAYLESGEDCGVWGLRGNTPDSLQNIKHGAERAEFDPRLDIADDDIVLHKRMASCFFETHLASLLVFHRVDTLIVTGGSTSGCVRATVVDGLSHGYRMVVPIECVADKHESPHFANLYDMALKYADVMPAAEVAAALRELPAAR